MRSLKTLIKESLIPPLPAPDVQWLRLLQADWQVVADLAGADLVMWLPTGTGAFVAVALSRPSTATTVHVDDVVGLFASTARAEELQQAFDTGEIVDATSVNWAGSYSMTVQCVPVVCDGRVIAVISREANYSSPLLYSSYDSWTTQAADVIFQMIARGEYPYDTTPTVSSHGVPRVMDGVILLDENGRILKMTPNANSCMRRLGIHGSLVGKILVEALTKRVRDEAVVDETLAVVAMGRASWRAEVEANASTIGLRALPLLEDGKRLGAVILTRDVTEMRRREQELMTKDATIREIHHRVKNNLQTVSALLRMQSRRSNSEEVKAALHEAGRRVATIATVHEALSQNVDESVNFDEVASTVLRLAASVAATDRRAEVIIEGKFGQVPADAASALATVLTELVTNSVEHGMRDRDGTVWVRAKREGKLLNVIVEDDGIGISEGSPRSGLGTQIIHMMVQSELHGTIDWAKRYGEAGEVNGTTVTLRLHID